MIDPHFIRNFSIIAHIDHGKSTLADRLIEHCKGLDSREMQNQVLDSMDIERERGITIKAQTVRLQYKARDGNIYYLNLMDTPGHVDFSYEVSRCLAACEGSILVIDASQGVEAQTLANVYKAIDNDHELIPVFNKIDLPAADVDRVKQQVEDIIGLETDDAVLVSAKQGIGIEEVLEAIIAKIPPPKKEDSDNLQALLVDSWYDKYLGVVVLMRIYSGTLKKGTQIKMISTDAEYQVEQVGIFTPKKINVDSLSAGEIGFITGNIKHVSDCKIGDTITDIKAPCANILPGFKSLKQVVFCSIFPNDSGDFPDLRESLEKLQLNDASFTFEMEHSGALGNGFRIGCLGMLHLEIIQERLDREFDLDLITTAPSVIYKLLLQTGIQKELHNPADMPQPHEIQNTEEPWIKATILVPEEHIGGVLSLCTEKRGEQIELNYSGSRSVLIYRLPLAEIVFDFYDRLKSITRGYASFDWEITGYRDSQIAKVSILINGDPVEALSFMVYKPNAESRGREICIKLKDLIPRQQYKIAIQAAIGSKIVARETIDAFRKDVTAKLYGGDRTRKDKLLKKQKKGKKRMRAIGNINIPHNVFIDVLKIGK